MKTIIAGPRSVTSFKELLQAASQIDWEITEVVSGHARGADTLGERYANATNTPLTVYKANWPKFGKSAGYIRNAEMAKYADALLLIWDGESKGSKHMFDLAKQHGLDIHVHKV